MDMDDDCRRASRSNLFLEERIMAKTNTERSRKRRERMRAAGYQLVQVWLDSETLEQLDAIQQRKKGASRDSIISHAIWIYYEHG